MTKYIAVAQQKGGVGKSCSTVNLAASLVQLGYRVLLIDSDPQGNATVACGITPERTLYDVYCNESTVQDAIVETPHGFDMIGANQDLAMVEVELALRHHTLRNCLAEFGDQYDYVLFDLPPSLGTLTVNGLVASHSVLVPLQAEAHACEGLAALLDTIELVRDKEGRSDLKIDGVFLTMYTDRYKHCRMVRSEAADYLGKKDIRLFGTKIPRSIKFPDAVAEQQPAVLLYKDHAVQSYMRLAREFTGHADA